VILANSDIFTNNVTVNSFANLGNVGNIYIGGGNSGAVLSTDGLGNLNWSSSPGVTEIQNGNSNVTIPVASGNIYINANSGTDQQWVFDTTGILTLANNAGYAQIASLAGSNIDIYTGGSGSQYSEIYLVDNGNIYVNTQGATHSWIFDNTGNLTVPASSFVKSSSGGLGLTSGDGNSYIDLDPSGIYLYTAYNTSEYEWNLDSTGNTTFPAVGTANLGNLVTANYGNFANDVTITGNANVTGNVSASNFSTTGSAGNITGANVIFANSFTSNGGTVDFNTNNANVLLGNIANVHIYGGSNGQALITDGTGNLSWTSTANVSEIYNGNSNVTIPTTDGNVYINANSGSDQQWVFDTNGVLTLSADGAITAPTSLDFYTGNVSSYSEIYMLDGPGGNVTIATNAETQNWTFDQNGILTLANGSSITGQPNTAINFYTNSSVYSGIALNDDGTNSNVLLFSMDGTYNWTFDQTGNLILPNASSGYAVVTTPAGNNISIQTGGANYSQIILNDNADIILYGNAQNAEYVFGANGTFSVGSGATIDFNTNGANVKLGSNANVHIYGGNSGQVLQTDGTGNLNWYSISATEIVNGNSNVTIPTANDSVYIYTNGTYEWTFDATGNTYYPAIGTVNLGNLITANYANFANDANIQGNLEVVGNIQTGGGSGGNISGVNYLFADYANLTNDLNANGNVNANNANITANLTVSNANVTTLLTAYNTKLTSATSTQIIYANGSSYLVGNAAFTFDESSGNVKITGNANVSGNVVTNAQFVGNTLTSTGTYLTIASDSVANGTYNINLVPGGAGNVDVHSTYITSLADPVNPQDAATKQYVDSTATGLFIHTAANVLSSGNLNATYANGGTTLSVTDIIGNNTIQFSTNHGLSANADISFTNAFNGLNAAPDVYWVDTVPAPNQITLKETYFGPIVANLTPGTGLSQPALAQSGVGATLTNNGTQAVLTIDSITLSTGQRVLVNGQTNQAYNGIYDVTTAGTGSTNWVLTRSSDGDTFVPESANALCAGSYFFISQGVMWAGSSWVLQTAGEIDIGISNVSFTQFSQSGSYTGANGILVTGTVISANVDNVTTAIIGGNIAVANSAQLVTPNIGAATGTNLSLTGNLLAGNVNSNATILGANITANVDITTTTGNANIAGNILANFIVSNNDFTTSTGSFTTTSGNINANAANITTDITAGGNISVITGNVTSNGLYANSLAVNNGGNANITGNLLANYITANYDANINGNANVTNTLFVGNTSSNVTITNGNANLTGNIFVGNGSSNVAVTNDGNITATGTVNTYDANIANSIILGNTAIYQATVTTNMITANQTIAQISTTGVTGVEFFVKGVDSMGAKYSVATVQAVTDGTTVDYSTYATVGLGGVTGVLVVNITGGNVLLQVTPSSSNSTVWTTQFRTI
jgi:hypothetical protein